MLGILLVIISAILVQVKAKSNVFRFKSFPLYSTLSVF